jgi:hypothetical protein
MLFPFRRPALSSVAVTLAVYVVGIVGAAAVAAHVVWRFGAAALEQTASTPASTTPDAFKVVASGPRSVRREAMMTPLADRTDGRWGAYGRGPSADYGRGAPFGTSSRYPYQTYGRQRSFDWDDDDDDRYYQPATGYRTMCVRLCDGYYFPIGFAVTSERLERDRATCENRCGGQGRLFVLRSLTAPPEDMVDLQGRPYRQLRTALLYRSEYVPSCKCQPDPWDAEARDRHRAYALAEAARKGDRKAAAELQALQAKMREAAKLAARPGQRQSPAPAASSDGTASPAAARQAEIAKREDGSLMGLGSDGAAKPKGERNSPPLKASNSDRDWIRRAFEPGAGR